MKHIVGFSGGVDSQAVCGLLLELHGPDDVIITNSDAGGNEHPLTIEHVEWYSSNVHQVIRCPAIISDLWETPGAAEERGHDGSAIMDFPTLIKIKRRPPSRKAQFCTYYLKLVPQRRWIRWAFGPTGPYDGEDYVRYTGVRRDESEARAKTVETEWDEFFDCPLCRPIYDWEKQRCFDYVKARGEKINPLYTYGFSRVGCAPCISSSKADILNWATRFPEMIDKIRRYETDSGHTFFAPMVPGFPINHIDEVVEWAKTGYGGRQQSLLFERKACESKYGLCE